MDAIDNRYRIIKTLGSGLSGEVLAVEDDEGPKALKFLKRVQLNVSREEALVNFKSEFSILSELNHPGIARILDFGFDHRLGKYFFTSEIITGKDFFEITENQPMEIIENLAVQVLRSLSYLHSRGVYHLDIKPQNILVQEKNGELQAKLIDFGLASFAAPRKKVGTPAYMAPEVVVGGSLDGRTDLYSFGVLLYKAFTRTNPYASKDIRECLDKQQHFTPEQPSAINPLVPKHWDKIILRLLEKNPLDRYPEASFAIRDINFLANKNYEIETIDTRLSYLPEKGKLVGRKKETEIFKNLFDLTFLDQKQSTNSLLVIQGKNGTGKSRLISEFKYYSQLHNVPVIFWKQCNQTTYPPPSVVMIDEAVNPALDEINQILKQAVLEKILIVWATEDFPQGLGGCEKITLNNFTIEELTEYLTMVTGLSDPPTRLIREIFNRTDGNPLFVTELLKTLLGNNLLLDASGRWVQTTFEDLGINFEKIKVPKTLSELLQVKYAGLGPHEKNCVRWMSVFNRPVSFSTLKEISGITQPQGAILNLTRDDIIERTDREQHYFFSNLLLRDVIYEETLTPDEKKLMHDQVASYLETKDGMLEECLYHVGQGKDERRAIGALEQLATLQMKADKYEPAVSNLTKAYELTKKCEISLQIDIETKLAESLVLARDHKTAVTHYEHLKEFYDDKNDMITLTNQRMQVYEKLGDLYAKLDRYSEALKLFETALSWLDQVPKSHVHRMLIQNHMAHVHLKSGEIDKAWEIYQSNHKKWDKEFTDEEKRHVANNWLADVLILKKEYEQASIQIAKDATYFESIGANYLVARSAYVQGDLFFKQMHNIKGPERAHFKEGAIRSFEKSLTISKKIGALDLMLRSYNGVGNVYFYDQDYAKAIEEYDRALAIARKLGDYLTAGTIALNMGNSYKMQKNFRDSYAYLMYSINTLEGLPTKNTYTWIYLFNALIEISETYRELNDLTKGEEALTRAGEIMKDQNHLSNYAFWVYFEKSKNYHRAQNITLRNENLNQAENLAKEDLEIEELKKFQEIVRQDDHKRGVSATSDFLDNKTMEKQETISFSDFENILKINQFLNSEHDPNHLLKMVLNYALQLSGAESGVVLLVNDQGELDIKATANDEMNSHLSNISTTAAKKVIETGESVISSDVVNDSRFNSSESAVLNDLKSVICLPLKSRNRVIGVLYMDNRFKSNAFNNLNFRILNAYCDQVGMALENARLIQNYRGIKNQLEQDLQKTTEELSEVKERLKSETSVFLTKFSYDHIIAKSKPMHEIFKMLDKITDTNLAVFLQGPSGTGKELIAKALHFNNTQRSQKRFVAVNCGAIPANLMESELFGYKAGSFTGANKDKKGLFEEAHGGTLFLDEVADLAPPLQVKLLRVLQEGEVQRIGDTKTIKVDVRIISASHKPLDELTKKGGFREDLYYRLCQIRVTIPPLDERKEDIALLAEHFIEKYCEENKITEKLKLAPELMRLLHDYNWPGNVRELENIINVACALRSNTILDIHSIPQHSGLLQNMQTTMKNLSGERNQKKVPLDNQNIFDPSKTWEIYDTIIIAKCFKLNGFKKRNTAAMLDISPSTLYKKLKDFNLEDHQSPYYSDPFIYTSGKTLREYVPIVFQAALIYADNHPYAAIRQLDISQGFFYKVIKPLRQETSLSTLGPG